MRVINVHTLMLTDIDPERESYAILSHTWGSGEVIYQEWELVHPSGDILNQCPHVRTPASVAEIQNRQGYDKIRGACGRARQDGFKYLWCDTVCIDKKSSAELSEAINSMYAWYQYSKVCYAYLADVKVPKKDSCRPKHYSWISGWLSRHGDDERVDGDTWTQFQKSRWWTRGWTLQELLAPVRVVFFANDWTPLGTKAETSGFIAKFTTIHKEALENRDSIPSFSVAQRMSWAADRQTTKKEDTAYSLLGIFDVRIPIIYGQGNAAFFALQKEIINNFDDHSILAWECLDNFGAPLTAALAESPANFRNCGSIICPRDREPSPSSVTNAGVSMTIPVLERESSIGVLTELNCALELRGRDPQRRNAIARQFAVWIHLQPVADNIFVKCHVPSSNVFLQNSYAALCHPQRLKLYISHDPDYLLSRGISLYPAPSLHTHRALGSDGITLTVSCGQFNAAARMFLSLSDIKPYRVLGLGCRKPFQMSHRFVSTSSHTTIISAAWNAQCEPCRWLTTTIRNHGMHPASSMVASTEWQTLCEQSQRSQRDGSQGIETALTKLHDRIRNTYGQEIDGVGPLTFVEDLTLEDLRDQREILLDFVMRE